MIFKENCLYWAYMSRSRIVAFLLLLAGLGFGYFVYVSETSEDSRFPFQYGLDLRGGVQLIYEADVSEVPPREVAERMRSLREVMESRADRLGLGVAEPRVQAEGERRLIVELPGVSDIDEAIERVGSTPELEFKLFRVPEGDVFDIKVEDGEEEADDQAEESGGAPEEDEEVYISTGLTGRFIVNAQLQFDQLSQPSVLVRFNAEGRQLFRELTEENVGQPLAIILDGEVISAPVIREVIRDGSAVISGGFSLDEARALTRDLNFGSLPLPISLLSTQVVGATLGEVVLDAGVYAGAVGIALILLFLILWYRFSGVMASISLIIYILIMLTIFKLIPVTLTAAGIAGFILSIGMAVDANVLIFERIKEELLRGRDLADAVNDGFSRAWPAIRDGNVSSILTALILFWFGTSLVQGFALTFGLGVFVSMLSAIIITRTFMLALGSPKNKDLVDALYGSGVAFKKRKEAVN